MMLIIESICFDHLLFDDKCTPRCLWVSTIFRIVPFIMSSKLLSLKTLEINITSVVWGLKIISHFLPNRLISVSLRLRLIRFCVCLLMNNLMMCHRQKVRLNQSNHLKYHLCRLKIPEGQVQTPVEHLLRLVSETRTFH